MVLLINACARAESRTLPLARKAAARLDENFETLDLYAENPQPLNARTLAEREALTRRGAFSDPFFRLARQFREAEAIVIAAPYWDLSFPAVLKCYLESVCVNGLTFRYNEKGIPEGLCRAGKLVYVTTAGGFIPEQNFGFDYIRRLCLDFFGIPLVSCVKAEGLDILGADVPAILRAAEESSKTL